MRVPRKPVSKWVSRKFSKERLERIRAVKKVYRQIRSPVSNKTFREIFLDAERILEIQTPEKSRFIFVGRGMRPLFESARALNELSRQRSRKDLKYFVTPFLAKRAGQLVQAPGGIDRITQQVADMLEKSKIVSKKKAVYYIVDSWGYGFTSEILANAIQSVNSQARVALIRSSPGIDHSDYSIARPTVKLDGRQSKASFAVRSEYLWFQKALQEFIDERKRQLHNQ